MMDDTDILWTENRLLYNVLCFFISENQKLYSLSDAKLYWRTVLHVLALINFAFVGISTRPIGVLLKNSDCGDINALDTYKLGFLTGWNIVFQTFFLFLSLTHDALEWIKKHHSPLAVKISYWRDVIFSGLVVPYTCFVFTMFWSLFSIDRELVFPKVYDEVIPWWFNQCVHTNILVLVVLETLLQPRRHPRDEKMELSLNAGCGILYAIVYYSIYFFANRWLYNVFGIMNWWQICLFQCCIWGSSYIFYIIQFPLNRLVHREDGQKMSQEESVKEKEDRRESDSSLKYRNVKEHSSL